MRSPSAVLLLISCFFIKFARSQSNELLVEGQTGKLYLEHTVVAKENWYSVGRLYNITPKELTAFNQVALTQPLTIGQKLEIPLTAVNFSQTGQKAAGETLVPVYYVIQEKEWMYRISVNHNKVPIPNLEKWNNVNKDQIHAGLHLIVGYLKVKTALSALAASGAAPAVAAAKGGTPVGGESGAKVAAPGSGVAGAKGGAPVGGTPVAGAKAGAPVAGAIRTGATNSTQSAVDSNPPAAGAEQGGKVKEAGADEQAAKGKEKEVAAAEQAKPKETVPPAATSAVTTTKPVAQAPVTSSHNGGSFKGDYGEAGKSATGLAGTFKSTSGWQDGKYYALMNNTPVGTIVRVDDPSTGKTIYAKVLGQLPDMKESAGLTIRISNAAAAELGEGEGKFNVEVKY
ncbi:MAG TPA: LysM peptidoglycan-binding domain-containing protein [Puia sp.]|nr:LysM peptidoglycan-binding domain-containing protein [Puia sp.]